MLSRSQFESASKAFSRRHPQWSWGDGHRPGYGYLMRTTTHFQKSPNLAQDAISFPEPQVEEDDLATAQPAGPAVIVQEYIVYSASFGVPAFYFTIHNTNGTPLSLAGILQTTFFKSELPSGSEATTFALTVPSTSFPLLSQGDHPTLGTPCWYFHPCESDKAVREFLSEIEQSDWSEETRLVRWLELWIMIVGSVLNL
ncbi:hypothetical protein GALMADRAFT_236227 [Galerina marginata CBS 339.88]|uniref:Ubiquitin-like-conjugating enzyme ATG10 n=1 Tax=Galerina marginata (strain CBS 339.88) TaxID=685588 RepID=A0A067TNB5_GALM3|nr:hypothetical protein GALMADRAFT_236227 [Galerina marginata CBS 339.88]